MTYLKGSKLILTNGSYSDHQYHGPFVVLEDWDQAETLARFRAFYQTKFEAHQKADRWTYMEEQPSSREFMGWLIRERLIELEEGIFKWHLGDGSWNFKEVQPYPETPEMVEFEDHSEPLLWQEPNQS